MAVRKIEGARVSIVWSDAEDQYIAKVTLPGEKRARTVRVGRPPSSRLAVDSKAAYDDAARAAHAFAVDEDEGEYRESMGRGAGHFR